MVCVPHVRSYLNFFEGGGKVSGRINEEPRDMSCFLMEKGGNEIG